MKVAKEKEREGVEYEVEDKSIIKICKLDSESDTVNISHDGGSAIQDTSAQNASSSNINDTHRAMGFLKKPRKLSREGSSSLNIANAAPVKSAETEPLSVQKKLSTV